MIKTHPTEPMLRAFAADELPLPLAVGVSAHCEFCPECAAQTEIDAEEEEEPTVNCPYCRTEIWEEAVQCPECGEYLSHEDQQARQEWKPRWVILTALLCLLLFALGAVCF